MAATSAEQRFEAIYREHERDVYAYLRRRTDPSHAQDCAAETFLVLWRRLADVPEGDRTLPWLYGTARRVLANHRRSIRRAGRLVQKIAGTAPADPPQPEAVVVRKSEDQEVLDALGRLRSADRELLMLALWEEVPRESLADMNGCSAHALSQRIHRATKSLARQLPSAGHKHDETAPKLRQGDSTE